MLILNCFRCGSTKNTLRRVDKPAETQLCQPCLRETGSVIVKVSNKMRVLVGPLGDALNQLGPWMPKEEVQEILDEIDD